VNANYNEAKRLITGFYAGEKSSFMDIMGIHNLVGNVNPPAACWRLGMKGYIVTEDILGYSMISDPVAEFYFQEPNSAVWTKVGSQGIGQGFWSGFSMDVTDFVRWTGQKCYPACDKFSTDYFKAGSLKFLVSNLGLTVLEAVGSGETECWADESYAEWKSTSAPIAGYAPTKVDITDEKNSRLLPRSIPLYES
jgi:hypothetical protein